LKRISFAEITLLLIINARKEKRWYNDKKKKVYLEALELYTCERNSDNFTRMKQFKKNYKYYVRKTKKEYNVKRGRDMDEMRRKKTARVLANI
jgi:hypothetical protein